MVEPTRLMTEPELNRAQLLLNVRAAHEQVARFRNVLWFCLGGQVCLAALAWFPRPLAILFSLTGVGCLACYFLWRALVAYGEARKAVGWDTGAGGWTVKENGVLSMHCAAPHQRGAIVNWLIVARGLPVGNEWTDEFIYETWERVRGEATAVRVELNEVVGYG